MGLGEMLCRRFRCCYTTQLKFKMDQPTQDSSKAQAEAQNSMDVFIQRTLLDFLRDKKGENIAATRTPPNSFARTTMDEMRPLTAAPVPSYNRQGLATIAKDVDLSQIESDIIDISLDVDFLTLDVEDLEERMDVAESDILTAALDIDGLDLDIADLDERLTTVETTLANMTTLTVQYVSGNSPASATFFVTGNNYPDYPY